MATIPHTLPENDRQLIKAVAVGDVWPENRDWPTPEQLADPEFVKDMPAIQASTIRALCLGLWDGVTIDPMGVRIVGARIEGTLDLSFGNSGVVLTLISCHLAQTLTARHAQLQALYLNGCRLENGLVGDGLQLRGSLFCRAGFLAIGGIRLLGARIGGNIDFNCASLDGGEGSAFAADGLTLEGNLFCRDEFSAKGEFMLLGAHIGGDISFSKASLDGGEGPAFNADGLTLEGNLFCRSGFVAVGGIRLFGARIGGDIDLNKASLDGGEGPAFSADGLTLEGSLLCQNEFSAKGEFRLVGAHIRGNIDFDKASLDDVEGPAFNADGLTLEGNLFCRVDFSIAGNAILVGTSIKGLFDWRPDQWQGRLDLSHARAGSWRDCWRSTDWTKTIGEPRITLDDFQYGSFFADNRMDVRATSRIAWIASAQGKDFKPGPYEVLARVLRAAGDYDGAVQVGLAKERARAKHRLDGSSGLDKVLIRLRSGFLDLAIGHGYRPWYGARLLAIWLVLGTALFTWGAPKGYTALWVYDGPGVIKPADPMAIIDNLNNKPGERAIMQDADAVLRRGHGFTHVLPAEYTPFSPFWYSLDTLIPLVDLGQERAWSPSPIGSFWQDVWGWALLIYLYIHIIMGWVLTTLTVVALTGLIKRDKEKE